MLNDYDKGGFDNVALRKESVDRNLFVGLLRTFASLSLSARRAWIEILTTGHGRRACGSLSARRAWIEIQAERGEINASRASLSARRAWIEMIQTLASRTRTRVALRKESVDRNCRTHQSNCCWSKSLSARRAWIEISPSFSCKVMLPVSLSARRAWIEILMWWQSNTTIKGRSPQGERG